MNEHHPPDLQIIRSTREGARDIPGFVGLVNAWLRAEMGVDLEEEKFFAPSPPEFNHQFLIALAGDEAVAYLHTWHHDRLDEERWSFRLYVHPAHRRRGIGSLLLREFLPTIPNPEAVLQTVTVGPGALSTGDLFVSRFAGATSHLAFGYYLFRNPPPPLDALPDIGWSYWLPETVMVAAHPMYSDPPIRAIQPEFVAAAPAGSTAPTLLATINSRSISAISPHPNVTLGVHHLGSTQVDQPQLDWFLQRLHHEVLLRVTPSSDFRLLRFSPALYPLLQGSAVVEQHTQRHWRFPRAAAMQPLGLDSG